MNNTMINAELARVRTELKVPKSQHNSFGNYNYRSQEDILEAVKPLLKGSMLTITDEMVEVGGRVYVKATAVFISDQGSVVATAYAREAESKKGMDEAQVTGSASSYARKYALNALFLIDDVKDADSHNNADHGQKAKQSQKKTPQSGEKLIDSVIRRIDESNLPADKKERFKKDALGKSTEEILATWVKGFLEYQLSGAE